MTTQRFDYGRGAARGGRSGDRKSQIAALRHELREALDPRCAHGKVRCLAGMTPEERARIEALYGAPAKGGDR